MRQAQASWTELCHLEIKIQNILELRKLWNSIDEKEQRPRNVDEQEAYDGRDWEAFAIIVLALSLLKPSPKL
jgi:hypothetical protein